LGEAGNLRQPDGFADDPDLLSDMLEIGRAPPGEFVLDAFGRIPQWHIEPVGDTELRATRCQKIIYRGGPERPACREFLIWEADGKAARIILAHLGICVGHGSPITVAGD